MNNTLCITDITISRDTAWDGAVEFVELNGMCFNTKHILERFSDKYKKYLDNDEILGETEITEDYIGELDAIELINFCKNNDVKIEVEDDINIKNYKINNIDLENNRISFYKILG